MKAKASNIARILADLDMILEEVIEITILPGRVRVVISEDEHQLVREYGVDNDA